MDTTAPQKQPETLLRIMLPTDLVEKLIRVAAKRNVTGSNPHVFRNLLCVLAGDFDNDGNPTEAPQ